MAEHVEVEMEALKRKLQKMRDNLTNPSPTMQKVSTLMYKDVMDHFSKESGPTSAWTPIQYRKGRILQDTGNLRNSITPDNTKDTAIVYSYAINKKGTEYSKFHQYGTRYIPQRKFLWISDRMRQEISRIIGKFIVE